MPEWHTSALAAGAGALFSLASVIALGMTLILAVFL